MERAMVADGRPLCSGRFSRKATTQIGRFPAIGGDALTIGGSTILLRSIGGVTATYANRLPVAMLLGIVAAVAAVASVVAAMSDRGMWVVDLPIAVIMLLSALILIPVRPDPRRRYELQISAGSDVVAIPFADSKTMQEFRAELMIAAIKCGNTSVDARSVHFHVEKN